MSMAGFPLATSAAAAGVVLLVSGSCLVYAVGPTSLNTSSEAVIDRGTAGTENMFQENKTALLSESYVNWTVSGPTDSNGAAEV